METWINDQNVKGLRQHQRQSGDESIESLTRSLGLLLSSIPEQSSIASLQWPIKETKQFISRLIDAWSGRSI